MALVFMPNDCPTSMRPCLTTIISYSWMTLIMKVSRGCRLLRWQLSTMAARRLS